MDEIKRPARIAPVLDQDRGSFSERLAQRNSLANLPLILAEEAMDTAALVEFTHLAQLTEQPLTIEPLPIVDADRVAD